MDNGEKATILVVDDNEIARYSRTRILKKAGFNVIEAVNGNDGIDKAQSSLPDIVLLDVNLPDINGFEVCKILKNNNKTSSIPIINISAIRNELPDKITGLKAGADIYLVEPIEPAELVATVNSLLRFYQTHKKLQETEQLVSNIMQNTRDMICRFMLKPQPRFVYVNPASTNIIGYTPEEHYADPYLCLKIVYPDDKPILEKFFKNDAKPDKPVIVRYIHKNGSIVWTESLLSPVYDADGQIAGFDSITRDITEEKKNEEERERLIIELEKALFEVKRLRGLIPICAGCKKIRNDNGYWQAIEAYLKEHADVEFTHSLCPDCVKKYYPEYAEDVEKELNKKESSSDKI
ncbi:MAG: response regulator [Verrucomicrobiia bacterium]